MSHSHRSGVCGVGSSQPLLTGKTGLQTSTNVYKGRGAQEPGQDQPKRLRLSSRLVKNLGLNQWGLGAWGSGRAGFNLQTEVLDTLWCPYSSLPSISLAANLKLDFLSPKLQPESLIPFLCVL